MKVVYTAPNAAHHYKYAKSLYRAGVLHAFVSGFSRLSPRAEIPEIGNKLYRADTIQTLYLASIKLGFPGLITSELAFLAKKEQDFACRKFVNGSDIFLFYNGSGLDTCNYAKRFGNICVVEAVNSHVSYQEEILKNEYSHLKVPFVPFHKREKEKRIMEYQEADYILLPSEFVKNSFLELGYPEEKLIKVPYGFNTFPVHQEPIEKNITEDFTILYVGSISIRKGLRYLISAFNSFNHPKKKLLIVGPNVSGQSGIKDIIIPEGVIFAGILKDEALEHAYKNAKVFCLPSIEEGLALVLGEALSFGIPIIATVNTGATDIITDGEEGFIVPIKDPVSISNKLQELADDNYLYEKMKANAIAKSKTLKGWDLCGELLVNSLQKALNDKKPIT
jgi:starch synthase